MKKILMAIDKLSLDGINPSCIAQNTRDSISLFREHGYEIIVCDFRARSAAGEFLEKAGLQVEYIGKGIFSSSILPAFQSIVEKHDAALIHCHGYNASNFGRIAGKRCGIPVIVHEHAVLKVIPYQFIADFLLRNRTTAGIAVSEAVKRFMVTGRSVPEKKIRVVFNGVNIGKYQRRDSGRIAEQRSSLGIPDDHQVVGTVTRLREEKGNSFLIQAAAAVAAKLPATTFVIAGDGPLRADLETLTESLGIRDHVKFAGFVDDVPAVLSTFDVAVIPSIREGFSFAAVEAMANGCAIVASRTGGLAEIIKHEHNGLHVSPGNSVELGDAIGRVLTDKELSGRLIKNGLTEAGKYSLETYADNVCALYEALGNVGSAN
jgi:glycosyltransferase involved in cell wall biosynthesis